MKIDELTQTLTRLRHAIHFREDMINRSPFWEAIEEYDLNREYTPENYQDDVDALLAFKETGQQLYDREYLGLDMHESVCACANPLSKELEYIIKSIKEISHEELT